MVRARLACSDGECAAIYEAYGPREAVEALACDCGCGLELLGWPEPTENREAPPELVLMPV